MNTFNMSNMAFAFTQPQFEQQQSEIQSIPQLQQQQLEQLQQHAVHQQYVQPVFNGTQWPRSAVHQVGGLGGGSLQPQRPPPPGHLPGLHASRFTAPICQVSLRYFYCYSSLI